MDAFIYHLTSLSTHTLSHTLPHTLTHAWTINKSHRSEPLPNFSVVLRCAIENYSNDSMLNLSNNRSLFINIYQSLHTHRYTRTHTSIRWASIGKWAILVGCISACGAPQTLRLHRCSPYPPPPLLLSLPWQVTVVSYFPLQTRKNRVNVRQHSNLSDL